jgi:hypothetical protein
MLARVAGDAAFPRYTGGNGMASDAIGGIAEDGAGRIWASTLVG